MGKLNLCYLIYGESFCKQKYDGFDSSDDDDDHCEDSGGNDVDDSYDSHDNVYDGCDDVEYRLYCFFTYYHSVLLSD